MTTSTLTRKNQTTIPRAVVKALGLSLSTQLVYDIEENGTVILSARNGTFDSVAKTLPKSARRRVRSLAEIEAAVSAGAAARFRRSES